MSVTASVLRSNIYKMLDDILKTGIPLQIERKGELLEVVPVGRPGKIKKLIKHDCLEGDPESIVHLNWSEEWNNDLP